MLKLVALVVAGLLWSAWLFAKLRECEGEPLKIVLGQFSRLGWLNKVLLLFMVVQLAMFGGAKHGTNDVDETDGPTNAPPSMVGLAGPFAGHGEDAASTNASRITEADYGNGYVLYRVGTNETHSFDALDDAAVATNWMRRGAANDCRRLDLGGMTFPFRDLPVTNLIAFADGTVRFAPDAAFPSFAGSLGIAPEANWTQLDESHRPSVFWSRKIGHDRFVMTWQNALLDRDPTNGVSYQVELNRNGNIICRYDLPGTNVTSASYHRLMDVDRTNPDADGDGLTTEEEIFDTGTDPHLADTDGDGVPDGEEMRLHTNAFSCDTDDDGFADATDPRPTTADGHDDADGDGLPDAWKNGWFGEDAAVSLADDSGQDGINNLNALLMGVNPLASGTNGFVETASAKPVNLNAWALAPSAFSFVAPTGTCNLITRTFAVGRTSPWQHLLVSSCPNRPEGWSSADIAIVWHAGDLSGVVPVSAADSWRIPLDADFVAETMTFEVVVTGPQPSLSRPLYLLRWTPHLEFAPSSNVSVFRQDRLRVAVRLDPETGAYELPFEMSTDYPHRGGLDAEVLQALELSPVARLKTRGRTFSALSPEAFDLPQEGTQPPSRLIFYRMIIENSCEVSSGPRASQYATPYPLDTRAVRRSYREALTVSAGETISVSLLPDVPDLGYTNLTPLVRAPRRLLGAAPGPALTPPVDVGPTVGGEPCTNDTDHVESGPDGYDPEPDQDGDDDDDDCDCDSDGPSLGSFRIRLSLGEPGKDERSGYLWTVVTGRTAVAASIFNILGTEGVSAVTNDAGDVTVTCSDNGGRTIVVSNVLNGVDIPVRLASGELDSIWQIRNPGGDLSTIRAVRLTHLLNATSDETYAIRQDDDGNVLWEQTDNIRGVRRVRRETADPENPEFVLEEFEQTYLADRLIREETRTYECVGAGVFGVRRLSAAEGFDERGWHSEARTYWCDARNRHRHGKLRSVRSNRQAWTYHDYDSTGRETVRIEQMDGSPFPELSEVSLTCALSGDTSAKVTVMDYATSAGDGADRNDSELPRLVETYVRRNGGEPVLVSRTERTCTREYDSRRIPVRRIVTTEGFGAAVRTSTRLEYPGDAAVPTVLRGMEIYSEEPDGSVVETEYAVSNAFIVATARTSFGGHARKTYTVTVTDAAFGNVVREETRLTANDAVIEWTTRSYDDRRRLRSSAYSDGMSETNAYSCCRLLWKRDREGRRTLRSARTGTDSLYYAEEDVWRAGVAEDGRFRIVQHFFDGLGRETNTVTYAGSNEGEAADPVVPTAGQSPTVRTTEYIDEWNCRESITTDERGALIEQWECSSENVVESHSQTTADGKAFGEDRTAYRGGRTETYRWWGEKWTRQTASTGYGADGSRVDTVVTVSSDYGTVTNSVITYDPLGRIASSVTPLGSTVFAYDGATTRILTETVTAGDVVRVRTCLYDDGGEEVGSVADGVTERSDVAYEEASNAWWRVTTESSTCENGTNAMTVTREQLTGLGDGLRSRVMTDIINGVKSCKTVAFDYGSGVATEMLTSSAASPVVSRSVYGIETSRTTEGEEVASSVDAWGRCVGRTRTTAVSQPLPWETCVYDEVGDLVERYVFTNGTEAVAEFYEYDQLGNRTSVVNANGEEVLSAYDAQGNLVSEGGATYPVQYDYDTANRRIAMRTTRDGETWDETRWTYDPATGLCTSKRRADGTTVSYAYTPDGLLETTTRSNGHWVRNVYDATRQLVGVVTDEDDSVAMVRDVYGRETAAQNGVAAYAYQLDDGGIATNETVTIGGEVAVIRRGLDDNGRIVNIGTDKNGQTGFVSLAYRPDGRLTSVTNGEVSVAYTYSDDGFDTGSSLSVAGGVTFAREVVRDGFRRELVTRVENGIGADFTYGFDALGRPVSRNGDSFAYDARGQVTATSLIPHPSSLIPVAAGYTYDEIGNLLASSANAETNRYVSNCLNQYTEISQAIEQSEQSNNPVYDAEGNLTQCGEWSYTYDAQNRLATVSSNGLLVASNFYDHMGRRVRMVTSEASYTFIYDGWNLVLELAERGGETERTEYYWGKDISGALQDAGGIGGLLYLKRNGTIFVPIYDAYGNVMEYRTADGSLVASYAYDAFGRTIAQSGSLADTFRHRHVTKFYEPETGFYYYGYRHYVPSLARWLTTDPLEEDGGLNLYAFCGNNALSRWDALGQWPEGDFRRLYCIGDCLEEWRWDWQKMMDKVLAFIDVFSYMPKTAHEIAIAPGGKFSRVSPDTIVLHRMTLLSKELAIHVDRVVFRVTGVPYNPGRQLTNFLGRLLRLPNKGLGFALNIGKMRLLTNVTIAEGLYDALALLACSEACCVNDGKSF